MYFLYLVTLYPSIFQRSDTGSDHVIRTLVVPTSLIIILDMEPGSERLVYMFNEQKLGTVLLSAPIYFQNATTAVKISFLCDTVCRLF